MKFCTHTLIDNSPDPISGRQLTSYERFQHVVRQAQWAEELGFDGYGVGERHAAEHHHWQGPKTRTEPASKPSSRR